MVAGSIRVLVFVLAACQLWAADSGAVAEAAQGTALAREGKYELAIQHYKAALRLNPHLPGLQPNLGLAYFKSHHFREAIRIHPSKPDVHYRLGRRWSFLGREPWKSLLE